MLPLDVPPVSAAASAESDSAIPPPIRAMLDAAMASGNENDVKAVAKYAAVAAPGASDELVRRVNDWQTERRASALRVQQQASFFELLKVHAELGGYRTTGNTNDAGLTAVLDLKREGPRWRHKVHLQTDYLRSNGVTSREHYVVDYEPNYRLDPRTYIYGQAQYESDRYLGFNDRVSVSVGAGYSAIKRSNMTLDVELGPAFRGTEFTDDTSESNIAARGSLDFGWKLTHALSLKQNTSAYLQEANSTVSSKSALDAKLIGPLSAQLSYTMQYESLPASGAKTTDTTSRASLVVDF